MTPNPKLRQIPAALLEAMRTSESGAILTSAPQRAIKRLLRAVWRVCFENHGQKMPFFSFGCLLTLKTTASQNQPANRSFNHV